MSSRFLLVRDSGDGRPRLESDHQSIDLNTSANVVEGDVLVRDSTTRRFKERAAVSEIVFIAIPTMLAGGVSVWANMGAGLTELYGDAFQRRTKDLRGFTQWRLAVNVQEVGAAGSVLGAQYSLDAGANWAGLDNGTDATNSTVTQAITSTGATVTAWAALNTAARVADVLLRIAGSGGDGAADPGFRLIALEVR